MYNFAKRWVVHLLRVEALALLIIAAYLAISSIRSEVTSVSGLLGEIFFAILGSLGLYFASVGFQRGKSYGRAPAVLANLIALGVSYFMYSGDYLIGAIPLSIFAFLTLFAALFGYQEPTE